MSRLGLAVDQKDSTRLVSASKTSLKDFIIVKKIGEGSYSSVWKVKRK